MCDEFTADVIGAKSYMLFIIDTICGFADFSICGFRCDWVSLNYHVSRNKLHHIVLKRIAAVGTVLVQQLCHLTSFIADGVILIVIGLDVFKLIQRPDGDIKRFIESSLAHIEQGAGIIEVQNRSPHLNFILQFI